ncbi:putative chorismate binding enzyme [Nocardioidaceae bacterium Broad-1]|uniref:anthranilate synthase component I family protein n=1 Tax=Nocardioides luteus TaxID=1844 RepID=UPI000202818E|nr:anthranilate synthase component I family protein [Nocardioides luteus]EGD44782.1 putative chorismate binding enzyme [Nocardioidaceae bacterium Broad-1]MBG6099017.1 para-aminobenzoate synthetase [Nocardioides luteus]
MSVEDLFAEVAAAHPRCVWLDGGGAREWSGTRSLIGWLEDDDVSLTYSAARREVLRHAGGRSEVVGDDIWEVLEREVGPGEQWFGYLGYACRTDLPATPSLDVPDAVWMRPSHVRLFDHPLGVVGDQTVALPVGNRPFDPRLSAYRAAFDQVQEALRAGDTYEANLTYRTTVEAEADPVETYLRLRSINPAPYAGFLQHDVAGHNVWLLSSSPERYAVIGEDRVIETRPIKGTTPRGATEQEDAANAELLRTDPKLRSENLMITDLLRNDLAMVCEPGTVEVPGLMQVESYETVHQLVTTVRGHLSDGITTVEALRRLFPAGSMTGAPKLRTMEVIERAERDLGGPRAAYAGAFGWISGDGPADLGVVIRTLTTHDTRTWQIGTGGGITVRSDVVEEAAEARLKADRVRASLGR